MTKAGSDTRVEMLKVGEVVLAQTSFHDRGGCDRTLATHGMGEQRTCGSDKNHETRDEINGQAPRGGESGQHWDRLCNLQTKQHGSALGNITTKVRTNEDSE